jgi:replication factor A1
MYSSSSHQVDPDLPQAHELRGWYDKTGTNTSFRSQGGGSGFAGGAAAGFRRDEVKTLAVVQDTLLGVGDKPDYFNAKIRVVHIRPENISYTACPGTGCQKKVLETDEGTWRCEKCGKSYPNCEYRYVLSVPVPQSLTLAHIFIQ